MKNRKNKLFSFVGLISIIFFAILVFIFSSLFAIKQDELQEEYTTIQLGALEKTTTGETTSGSACSGSNYVYATGKNENSHHIPKGYYCVEKNATILNRGGETPEEFVKYWDGKEETTERKFNPPNTGTHEHAPGPNKSPQSGENSVTQRSATFWECSGNHFKLSPGAAFVVTDPSASEDEKQSAIWADKELNTGTYIPYSGKITINEKNYASFVEKMNGEEPMKVINDTAEIMAGGGELIAGPYTIEYIDAGEYGKITGMTAQGYSNAEGEGKAVSLDVDSQIPPSGEPFYVHFKAPADGTAITHVTINIEYSYMEAEAWACRLQGKCYIANATCLNSKNNACDTISTVTVGNLGKPYTAGAFIEHVKAPGIVSPSNPTPTPTKKTVKGQVSCVRNWKWSVSKGACTSTEQDILKAWGTRKWYKMTASLMATSTTIDEPSPTPETPTPETPTPETPSPTPETPSPTPETPSPTPETPSPTPEVPTPTPTPKPKDITMKLGGYVWEDVFEGKENLADGRRTENDLPIPNIKVTLFEQDGTQVASQFTDGNGYYEFTSLNAQKKYYVEFEYNGLIYMPTDYLKTESGQSYGSVSNMVNAGLYNTDTWAGASKATENAGERRALDAMLGEIGSSPNGYKSGSGYNEAFSILDLMGFELQPNGTFTRTGPQLIDGFYDIDENGNLVTTSSIKEGEITSHQKARWHRRKYSNRRTFKQIFRKQ